MCFQDSIHLCTKLRNRLLSPTTTLLMGNKFATVDHLLQLMDNFSKIDHGLTVSDVLQKDRQNFSSCEKISNEIVLSLFSKISNSEATQAYLQIKCLFCLSVYSCLQSVRYSDQCYTQLNFQRRSKRFFFQSKRH